MGIALHSSPKTVIKYPSKVASHLRRIFSCTAAHRLKIVISKFAGFILYPGSVSLSPLQNPCPNREGLSDILPFPLAVIC